MRCPSPIEAGGLGEAVGVDVGDRDARPALREAHRQRPTDPRPGPGDHRDPAAELAHGDAIMPAASIARSAVAPVAANTIRAAADSAPSTRGGASGGMPANAS